MKSRYTRKNIKNRKTKKTYFNLNSVSVKYYNDYYKNTKTIPKTSIINYMFNNYDKYLSYEKLCKDMDKNTLSLDDCFIINENDLPNGLRQNHIDKSFKMNPKTSLDKLIAYSFYIKQPFIFKNTIDEGLSYLKYQIGKDITRDDRNINGKLFDRKYYSDVGSNYKAADLFYQNIIDYYQINKRIDLNIVNKIALLSCQNVFGLITDLITVKLYKILEPETNSVFRPDKFCNIILKNDDTSMELRFKSQLIISRDGEPMNPEYPCGDIDFLLYINFLKNTYELKKFILNYDIDKCGPEIIKPEETDKPTKLKSEYIIPATVVSAGIIAMPILLSTLGGKKKGKNKTIKKKYKK